MMIRNIVTPSRRMAAETVGGLGGNLVDDSTSSNLLQRAGVGEPAAWHRLVLLYQPLIASWCQRGGLRADEVEDTVQEVLQAVAADLARYRQEGGPFRAWLRGITRHKVLDRFRARGRQTGAVGGSEAYDWLQRVPAPV